MPNHQNPDLPPVDGAEYGGPPGPVDLDLAAAMIAAALAGCQLCQNTHLEQLATGDPTPATYLLTTAYDLLASVHPPSDHQMATYYAPQTAQVYRTYRDDGAAAAAAVVAGLDPDGRRAALDDALDTIAGFPDALAILAAIAADPTAGIKLDG